MKKFLIVILSLFLFFSFSNSALAQQCSGSDVTGFNFQEPLPQKAGDDLNVVIQTSPNLFNKTVKITITNDLNGAVLVSTDIPVSSTGQIRPVVSLPSSGKYRINLSVGSSTCFESTYNFDTSQNTTLPPAPSSGASVHGTCGDTSIDTAIGCVPFGDQNALFGFFLRWGLGIGGGIAFILILFAGFQIMTSRGDPNRLKAGQELMTAAIAGLLLLIFSVIILKIIGVDILNLPIGKSIG